MPIPEIHIVREISSVFAETEEYGAGLNRAAELLCERLGFDLCRILVQTGSTGELRPVAWCGGESPEFGRGLPLDRGLPAEAFRTRATIQASVLSEHPAFDPSSDRVWAGDCESALAFPLTARGRAVGVVLLAGRGKRRVSDRIVALAETVAPSLALFAATAGPGSRPVPEALPAEKPPPARNTRPRILQGTPVSGSGVVSGRAYRVAGAEILEQTPLEYADVPEAEKAKLDAALAAARAEAGRLQKQAAAVLPEADAAIFFTHQVLLDDPSLKQRICDTIDRGFSLRFSLRLAAQELEKEFAASSNHPMRERVADLKDAILRILEAADLLENRGGDTKRVERIPDDPIAVAWELLPSQLIRLPLARLAGIVCEQGGTTAHVAILAKALRLPMIVGVAGAARLIRSHDPLILDCTTGYCHLRPSDAVVRKFRHALKHHKKQREDEKHAPPTECRLCTMRDGAPVRLGANISLISELPLLDRFGAMGIGLYRTEFMFMIRPAYPSEEEQYRVFRHVVEGSPGHSVTLRILDVGGDKPLPYIAFAREDNPALGWRGMRFLLERSEYLDPHLRAILRTTVHGRVGILVPMVSELSELLEVKAALKRAEESLAKAGTPFDPGYRLGVMIEVPSAVLALPEMLPHIDFVSIGTNDLTQYMFAVDRGNEKVGRWFQPLHPVILRVLAQICRDAQAPSRSVSLCGELAGNPVAAPLLAGAGIRFLSMNPWQIPSVRRVLEKVPLAECRRLFAESAAAATAREVEERVRRFFTRHHILWEDDAP